jgi:hypothetical protein
MCPNRIHDRAGGSVVELLSRRIHASGQRRTVLPCWVCSQRELRSATAAWLGDGKSKRRGDCEPHTANWRRLSFDSSPSPSLLRPGPCSTVVSRGTKVAALLLPSNVEEGGTNGEPRISTNIKQSRLSDPEDLNRPHLQNKRSRFL